MAYTEQNLADIQAAILALATGSRRVEVRFADRTIKYSETDLDKLQALAAEIKAELSVSRRPRVYRAKFNRGY